MVSKFPFIANEFSGKRVLVTGGTSGIGKAVVSRLLEGGAKVVTTAREKTMDDENGEYEFVQADLSTSEGCTKVVKEVISHLGGIDILVNVVGASSAPSGGFSVLSDEEWQKELNINLMSAVRLDRGLLPGMIERGTGVIVHVSSIQRKLPLYQATLAYAAAKAALTTYRALIQTIGNRHGYSTSRINEISWRHSNRSSRSSRRGSRISCISRFR